MLENFDEIAIVRVENPYQHHIVDRRKKYVALSSESTSHEVLPYDYKKPFESHDNFIYGSLVRFFQGEDERESCRQMNYFYTKEIPRILILPNFSN